MNGSALRVVKDLGDDWPEDEPQAAAAAEAAPAGEGETVSQRGWVHRRAGALAREGQSTAVAEWLTAILTEMSASMRRSDAHGAPWEEQPPSITGLRGQVMRKAEIHAALPVLRAIYIIWGHLFVLPVASLGYGLLWLLQSPGRSVLAALIITVLWATGVLALIGI